MKNFYREELAPIVRLRDGGIAPNWPAAVLTDVALGTCASAACAGVVRFVVR